MYTRRRTYRTNRRLTRNSNTGSQRNNSRRSSRRRESDESNLDSYNDEEELTNVTNRKEAMVNPKQLYRINVEPQGTSNSFAYRFSCISSEQLVKKDSIFTVVTESDSPVSIANPTPGEMNSVEVLVNQSNLEVAETASKAEVNYSNSVKNMLAVAGPSGQTSLTRPADDGAIKNDSNNNTSEIDIWNDIENDVRKLLIFMIPTDKADGSRGSGRPRRQFSGRNARRQLSRRRAGSRPLSRRRGSQSSGETTYEVEDVEYEPITERNVARGRVNNWRVFPKYELSDWEAAQQEAELFKSFTKEERHEETRPPVDGEPACCVCYENMASRVVIPCGHRCLCYTCARNIALNRTLLYGARVPKLCPICQAAIAVIPRLC